MKKLLILILVLLLPVQTLAATLPESRKQIDTTVAAFQKQLLEERTQAGANNTKDLIDVGIHNLRILRAKVTDICYSLSDVDATVNRSTQSGDFTACTLYADQQYQVTKEIFRSSMLQDMYLKKTSLYEARLVTFNDHLNTILDILIFIRGTITKVQKGIDGTAAKTFTR